MNAEWGTGEVGRTKEINRQHAGVHRLTDASRAREARVAKMILASEREERFWSEMRGASGFC